MVSHVTSARPSGHPVLMNHGSNAQIKVLQGNLSRCILTGEMVA